MKSNKLLLVTTALEESWGATEDILFLGEWCKIYGRKAVWSQRNSKTLIDPWSDRERRYIAYQYSEEVYKRAIHSLADSLNQIHNLNYPVRYWEILCGPWLLLFINRTYHLWECINDVIDSKQDIETIKVISTLSDQVPIDIRDFESKIPTDSWNHYIGSLIIDFIGDVDNKIIDISHKFKKRPIEYFKKASKKRKFLALFIRNISKLFNGQRSVFVLNPYLSKLNKIKLSFRLRQIPQISLTQNFDNNYRIDYCIRSKMNGVELKSSPYEIFLRKFLILQIPQIYIEGYADLLRAVEKNKWPKYPISIITAVDHFSNDIFKCYVANKIITGSKFNIISHGGAGKYKYSNFQSLEFNLCDNYLTWGWTEYSPKCVKGFFIKDPGYKRHANNNEIYLLHVTLTQFRYQKFIDSSTSYEQFINCYLKDQASFLNLLSNAVNNNTITKLHLDLENSIEDRLNEECKNLHYAKMGENFYQLLKNAKIVVTTYNCTTPVESIAMNIPTIIFWNPSHWELSPSAIPIFNNLLACGVFHENPESAALMVNKIWDNIDAWWQSKEVIFACNQFRIWFGREAKDPIKEIVDFCYRK